MSILLQVLLDGGVETHSGAVDLNEITMCCVFCVERGFTEDTKFHLGINLSNGKAHCFRCNWKCRTVLGTATELSKALGVGLHTSGVRRKGYGQARRQETKAIRPVQVEFPPEYESLAGTTDPVGRKAKNYLLSRGVTLLQIIQHKIGFASWGTMAGRVVFPVFGKHQKLCGCVGRTLYEDIKPKYLNTAGSKVLYNGYVKVPVAILTEGIMDALSVERALLQANMKGVAVCGLGSSITTAQVKQLQMYERVIILPDWDMPGVRAAISLAESCENQKIDVAVSIPKTMDERDPGSMSTTEIVDSIKTAKPYSRSVEFFLRKAMCQ